MFSGAKLRSSPKNNYNNLFNGHFPGQPRKVGNRLSPFWILLELSMMEVTTGNTRHAKL